MCILMSTFGYCPFYMVMLLCFIFLYGCSFDSCVSYLCSCALDYSTMLIMVIYAILILIRMSQALRVKFSLICVHLILIHLLRILFLSYLFEILALTSKLTCGCTSITNSICNFSTLSFYTFLLDLVYQHSFPLLNIGSVF
jgi:hypothetical protein